MLRWFVFAALASTPLLAKTEILWDSYGVPHIFASNTEELFYGHGWAQAQNHADLLLKLYGESRGRAAEYWGESFAELDRWVHRNGVPARARQWYEAQSPEFKRYFDAFARGINDHAKRHPEHVSPQYRQVLPVTGIDVVGHPLRAVHYGYMGSMQRLRTDTAKLTGPVRRAMAASDDDPYAVAGSNTWTVGPPRSASGKSMLIINPHLAWDGFYTYMEVHLVAPGVDLYGAPQIGMATPVIGFNPKAGWGRTVNIIDTVDFYKLTVKGDQYQFDGAWRAFTTTSSSMKVKQSDGSFKTETITTRHSVHGPVVLDQDGNTVAMRVAGIDRPRMLEQWWRMGLATNLEQFKAALRIGAVPMWHANYADSDGHIYLVSTGTVPRRSGKYADWSGVVAGDTSATLWKDYYTLEEMPQSLDPASGFNQNENEQPWFFTVPQLDPSKYSPTFSSPRGNPFTHRTMRGLRMLTEDKSITYDELLGYKHNTRVELADAILPDLLREAPASLSARARQAWEVLRKWDRHFDAASKGGVLFVAFADRYFGRAGFTEASKYRVKFNPDDPLQSQLGIGDGKAAWQALEQAAEAVERDYGALDVAYGDVYRFERGEKDLPGNGGGGQYGLFRTMTFGKKRGNRFYPSHGETFVCAIEFGTPQKAQCALGYGNASQPGSKHIDDQLQLMADKKLHPVWRSRKEIEANLERKETLSDSGAGR